MSPMTVDDASAPVGAQTGQAHIIVVGNEKGGAGKSTVAMHLTVALLRMRMKVGILDLDGRPVSIRLNRIAAGDSAPVWVFAAQTVDNIPSLYLQHGPTAFERFLPDWLEGTAQAPDLEVFSENRFDLS